MCKLQAIWYAVSHLPDLWSSMPTTQVRTHSDSLVFSLLHSTIIEEREVWSAGVANVPAELVQAGGEGVITLLTTICNKIWQTGEWPTPWIQSLVITLPKKGNLQQCQNYRTISLINNPSNSCWRSYWTDCSHKWRKSSLKNWQASEQEGALQSRSSTYESSVRNTSSTSKTSTMSS